jgi:hypothetical protein
MALNAFGEQQPLSYEAPHYAIPTSQKINKEYKGLESFRCLRSIKMFNESAHRLLPE